MIITPTPVWALLTADLKWEDDVVNGTLKLLYSSKIKGQDAVKVDGKTNTITVSSQLTQGTPVILSLLDPKDGWRENGSLFGLQFIGINIQNTSGQNVTVPEQFPFYQISPTTEVTSLGVNNQALVTIDLPDWFATAEPALTTAEYPWALTWMYLNNLPRDESGKKYTYNVSFMFSQGTIAEVFTWDPTEEADH